MALNPDFVIAPSLQSYFVDKDTGFPLAGGKVFFYSDVNRTQPKTVYTLSGSAPNYSYTPLPNPVILSSVGTPMDNNGNDVIIYYFPLNEDGEEELYYVEVQDSQGVPQWTRQAWPNPEATRSGGENDVFNYIPNGQFLAHTKLPDENDELKAGSNSIAQGGWSFELPDPVTSINTLVFEALPFTNNPPQSPRFKLVANCTASGLDTIKNVRIKFDDVNKFSSNDDTYTYSFWADSDIALPVSIQVFKFAGTNGDVVPVDTVANLIITPGGNFYNISFSFGVNAGIIVDTVNNNDFVAIDIALPVGLSFRFELTDAVLTLGDNILTGFPIQTDADMITRGIDGWTNVPRQTGFDLYLPKVLTREGYRYDDFQIGEIVASSFPITDPLSTSPLPTSNVMPANGSIYLMSGYSANGIPFARLGQKLIANTYINATSIPKYGTGIDYATAYRYFAAADSDKIRITYNVAGSGSPIASDGNTGWDFTGIPVFNGSTTGASPIPYICFNRSGQTLTQIATFDDIATQEPDAGTTPFTVTENAFVGPDGTRAMAQDGVLAQQRYAIIITLTDGSTLVGGVGNPGIWWGFYDDVGTGYYIWYFVDGETDPAPPGFTHGIRVFIRDTYDIIDIANVTREALKTLQSTDIHVTTSPATFDLNGGDYWLFSSNPSSLRNFYVWYTVGGVGTDPMIPGRIGINVSLATTANYETVRNSTNAAINSYQFQVPDIRGLFLRGYDPELMWDTLAVQERFSDISGVANGNQIGTFQYQQILSHTHWTQNSTVTGANSRYGATSANNIISRNTNFTGGAETRPYNFSVEWGIRY